MPRYVHVSSRAGAYQAGRERERERREEREREREERRERERERERERTAIGKEEWAETIDPSSLSLSLSPASSSFLHKSAV